MEKIASSDIGSGKVKFPRNFREFSQKFLMNFEGIDGWRLDVAHMMGKNGTDQVMTS